jgi:hypothetical protein
MVLYEYMKSHKNDVQDLSENTKVKKKWKFYRIISIDNEGCQKIYKQSIHHCIVIAYRTSIWIPRFPIRIVDSTTCSYYDNTYIRGCKIWRGIGNVVSASSSPG